MCSSAIVSVALLTRCNRSVALTLGKEEVVREDLALCGSRITYRPYGELGTVEKSFCCWLVCLDSNVGTIIPGFGCDTESVYAIAGDLEERMTARGDTAQIQLNDRVEERAREIEEKMDLIVKHLTASPERMEMDGR